MPNRFARRIREGDIPTPAALASEFRALAKATHPDLAGPGADHGEFVRIREEYEAALRDFGSHRFGLRPDRGDAPFDGPVEVPEAAWKALVLLLKRGFPKACRHEKERLRYEYALWRFERALPALGGTAAGRFGAFSAAMHRLAAEDRGAVRKVLGLLSELAEHRATGIEALRTGIARGLEELRRSPLDPALAAFVEALDGIALG